MIQTLSPIIDQHVHQGPLHFLHSSAQRKRCHGVEDLYGLVP